MKLVSNQLSPNLKTKDSFLGLLNIFKTSDIDFSPYFQNSNYLLTNTARTALSKVIEVINPSKDKKIGIPSFICGVVATPFLTKGYEICWIDTDENGLISLEDFKQKVDQVSVVIVPHIFGQQAPLEEIYHVAKAKGVFVIEDGAHYYQTSNFRFQASKNRTFPLMYCNAKILSFGREKVYSCVSGGALLWKKDSVFKERFKTVPYKLGKASFGWTIRHVLQPLILSVSLPIWNTFKIGKAITALARKTNLLPLAVTAQEKQGVEDFPQTTLPFPLQKILQRQFQHTEKTLAHRKQIALKWQDVLQKLFPKDEVIIPENYFRVILKTHKQQEILARAEKIGFNLREWDGIPISPSGIDLKRFGYQIGSCPNAEQFAQNYVTFPTNIRVQEKDVERFLKSFS